MYLIVHDWKYISVKNKTERKILKNKQNFQPLARFVKTNNHHKSINSSIHFIINVHIKFIKSWKSDLSKIVCLVKLAIEIWNGNEKSKQKRTIRSKNTLFKGQGAVNQIMKIIVHKCFQSKRSSCWKSNENWSDALNEAETEFSSIFSGNILF